MAGCKPYASTSEAERAELRRLCAGRYVLELGTFRGSTTAVLCSVAAHVVTVDRYGPGMDVLWESEELVAVERLRRYRQAGRLTQVLGDFAHFETFVRPFSFEVVFVDGFHDLQGQIESTSVGVRAMAHGGAFAVHDWGHFETIEGAARLLPAPDRVVDSLAVWDRAAGR